MAKPSQIEVKNGNITVALQNLLKEILKFEDIKAVLVPRRIPGTKAVMPSLISDPQLLDQADPLSPCFPLNTAKMLSRLTKKSLPEKIAVVIRPCEIRAFTELVKLRQGAMENLLIIATDCLGAFSNKDYADLAKNHTPEEITSKFSAKILHNKKNDLEDVNTTAACQICEHYIPTNVDIHIGFWGVNTENHLMVRAETPQAEEVVSRLNLSEIDPPEKRREILETLMTKRIAQRDLIFENATKKIDAPDKLNSYLEYCVNCYNCRVACPVCYCKECVFVTDVFEHDPQQYLKWSSQKGTFKMPSDTSFFHITRIAHMSLSCVGCGQCSNACPNDIPLMEIFRVLAYDTQKSFNYSAGANLEEEPPLSVFKEDEYQEIVGV